MSPPASASFCPKCKNEVVFLHDGAYMRCPMCGFRFETGPVGTQETSGGTTFLAALLRVFLIMLAIVVVAVGVLFLGCIAAMNR